MTSAVTSAISRKLQRKPAVGTGKSCKEIRYDFVCGSSELNILRLPFFCNGKDPEDFDYSGPRCNPILRPAAARTPSHQCTPARKLSSSSPSSNSLKSIQLDQISPIWLFSSPSWSSSIQVDTSSKPSASTQLINLLIEPVLRGYFKPYPRRAAIQHQ
ncbi:Ulp1 protease family protein [Dorcoceras hygrometricum]|uniref:Ulp1 protease family protein n=1 Tax=Dorcoceras hygrometricum TaxID=472368 RepID=A0A2Z7CSR7_9LAMI|nr:Ulp1 protease family protein [Dorcoceras hygrometricum]